MNCRQIVEAAMLEMIDKLHAKGLVRVDVPLALADASEDYVMLLAKK